MMDNVGADFEKQQQRSMAISRISSLNGKIALYQAAMDAVSQKETSVNGSAERFQRICQGLLGNEDLSNVETKNVFEGDMASKLKEDVALEMEHLSQIISEAGNLETELSNQVQTIHEKIQELQNEIQNWSALL